MDANLEECLKINKVELGDLLRKLSQLLEADVITYGEWNVLTGCIEVAGGL